MSADEIDALIHPEDIEGLNTLKRNVLETPQGHEIASSAEYRVKCKDGSYRWISDHFALFRGPEGHLSFSIASVRDITERKEAEEKLRRQAALDRVRVSVYEMRESTDIQAVLVSLYVALKNSGVKFDNCSIQLVDEEKQCIEGEGSTFTVRLPVAGEPVQSNVEGEVM